MLFLLTLTILWAYNSYLSLFERKGISGRILMIKVLGGLVVKRFTLRTQTVIAVFVVLVLQLHNPGKMLAASRHQDMEDMEEGCQG
jgi:hypothetical protein